MTTSGTAPPRRFAALEAATGKVTGAVPPRAPALAGIPDVLLEAGREDLCPRKSVTSSAITTAHANTTDVRAWLDKHPRITRHFTPTSWSWLNLVGDLLALITRQAICCGSFTSVPDLITAIETFYRRLSHRCHPFTWTKTADERSPYCRPGKRNLVHTTLAFWLPVRTFAQIRKIAHTMHAGLRF